MSIKKSVFTYVTWVLYLVMAFGVLLVGSYGITEKLNSVGDIVILSVAFFSVIVLSLLTMALATLVFKIKDRISVSSGEDTKVMEYIFVFFIFVLGFMIRFIYLAIANGNYGGNDLYISLAKDFNFDSANITSNCSRLYVRILAFIFSSIGDKVVYSVYLNIAFQMIIVLCIYYICKTFIGRFAGGIAACMYTFIPYIFKDIVDISPETMVTAVTAISFTVLCVCCNKANNGNDNGRIPVWAVLAGLFTGVAAYLDLSGICIIPIAISMFIISKNSKCEGYRYNPAFQSLLFVVGVIISFGVCNFLKSGNEGISFVNAITNEYSGIIDRIKINYYVAAPAFGSYCSVIFMGFSILYIARAFAIQRDLGSPIILYGILVTLITFFGVNNCNYFNLVTFLWCIYSAVGICSLGTMKYIEKEPEYLAKYKFRKKTSVNTAIEKKEELPELDFLKPDYKPENKDDKKKTDKPEALPEPVPAPPAKRADKDISEVEEAGDAEVKTVDEPVEKLEDISKDETAWDIEATEVKETSKQANIETETEASEQTDMGKAEHVEDTLNSENTDDTDKESVSEEVIEIKADEEVIEQSNDGITDEGKAVAKTVSEVVKEATGNVKPPVKMSKFGRRMDYKTAIVRKEAENSLDSLKKDGKVSTGDAKPQVDMNKVAEVAAQDAVINTAEGLTGKVADNAEAVVNAVEGMTSDNAEATVNAAEAGTAAGNTEAIVNTAVVTAVVTAAIPGNIMQENTGLANTDAESHLAKNDKPDKVTDIVKNITEADDSNGIIEKNVNNSKVSENEELIKNITEPSDKAPEINAKMEEDAFKLVPGARIRKSDKIPNPLPLPKQVDAREMDFDVFPSQSNMHFDLVDMTGMDYFDLN